MKKFEKIAGIIILVSSVLIFITFFLPVFESKTFSDPVTPSMIIFGKQYSTSVANQAFAYQFYKYWPLALTYFLPIIPAGAFWLIQLIRVNKPIKYVIYFITLLSFSLGILFFITTPKSAAFVRVDVQSNLLYLKNYNFIPTIWGILTLVFASLGALSSGAALVKEIIEE